MEEEIIRTLIMSHNKININAMLLTHPHLRSAFIICYNELLFNELNKYNPIISCEQELLMYSGGRQLLIFYEHNALDLLTDLKNIIYSVQIYKEYKPFCDKVISSLKPYGLPILKYTLTSGLPPQKARESDVGYDITIVKINKKISQNTTLYGTGICLQIPFTYYAELYARSSISKTGYTLSNSVGIIDGSYRGELMISLTKIDPSMPNLRLPCKIAQLVIKQQVYMPIQQVEKLDTTARNTGGFGSTN